MSFCYTCISLPIYVLYHVLLSIRQNRIEDIVTGTIVNLCEKQTLDFILSIKEFSYINSITCRKLFTTLKSIIS